MALSGLRKIAASQTLLINEQSQLLEKNGATVVRFGFGQSPFPPPENVIAALQHYAYRKDYSPVQGLPELRQAVAAFHQRTDRLEVTEEQVLIGPGSKMLIYAFLACFDKMRVLVPAPAWVSYAPQARMLGHEVLAIPTSFAARWRVTPDALQQVLRRELQDSRPTCLILNYPGNPDGLTYDRKALKELAEVARQHGLWVISDEIYGQLHHQGKHRSIARYYPERTLVTGGLSKWCGAGGWRLGTALLPATKERGIRATMLGVASETYSCAPTPVQMAAITAYSDAALEKDYCQPQREILSLLGKECVHRLTKAGVQLHAPEGGFYLFPDFEPFRKQLAARGIKSSDALCHALLHEAGVALLPGSAFGMVETSLTARLAYVTFDGIAALEAERANPGGAQLTAVIAPVYEGIERITTWLEGM
jgi:aspartate aminotransferase